MAGLSGEIEQKVVPLYQRFHAVGIADVGNIDFEAGFVTANVCRIPAILGDKAVDERNGSAFLKKADAKIGADEPQPSRDEHMRAGIETHYRILRLRLQKRGAWPPFCSQWRKLFGAELNPHEADHGDRLADGLGGALDEIADRHLVVADIELVEQAHVLAELLDRAFGDLCLLYTSDAADE